MVAMTEEEKYTVPETHRLFAIQFNGETWDLLGKSGRTKEEDERMVYAAHASCRHWLEAGSSLHHQRGEWLIARVYTVLNRPEEALRHAYRCLELTQAHAELMHDFDWAYAYECVGRANAIAGNPEVAVAYIARAEQAGRAIADDGDRKVFLDDFNGGVWRGMR